MTEKITSRITDSLKILVGLIVLFIVINLITNKAISGTVTIDGDVHSITARELTLTPMTEDGLERLSEMKGLERLTVIPYKQKLRIAVDNDNIIEDKRVMYEEIEKNYGSCTDISDISFLKGLDKLEYIDLSYCAVEDISVLAELKGLQEINISYTNVKDITPLLSLPDLISVNITGLDLTDENISQFTDKGFSEETDDVTRYLKEIAK